MEQAKRVKQIMAFFNGQLTAEEEQELADWIKADSNNRLFFQAEKEKLKSDDIRHGMLESTLAELKMKIDLKHQFKPETKILFKLTRIAAIFILILGFGFLFAFVFNKYHKSRQTVTWFETATVRGEKSKINLPDGSSVWLNAETTIRYPNNFADGNRLIKLNGEAYFEVARDEENPFIINTGDITTTVLGTSFNILELEGDIMVTVASGKVMVTNEKTGQKEILVKNDQVSFNHLTEKLQRVKTNYEFFTAWSKGVLYFNNVSITEAIKRIEKWYDVTINCDSENILSRTILGEYQNKSLDYILRDIEFMLGIKYQFVNDSTIIIEE